MWRLGLEKSCLWFRALGIGEEDLLEGHSRTRGVGLHATVGVGLLSCVCVCAVFDPHLPTGNERVTREPEVAWQPRGMTLRSMRTKIINHSEEKMWSLSKYSGEQLGPVMMVEQAEFAWQVATVLAYIAIMSENLTNVCPILVLSWVSVVLQVAMTTGTNPKLRVAHELDYQVVRSAGAAS